MDFSQYIQIITTSKFFMNKNNHEYTAVPWDQVLDLIRLGLRFLYLILRQYTTMEIFLTLNHLSIQL